MFRLGNANKRGRFGYCVESGDFSQSRGDCGLAAFMGYHDDGNHFTRVAAPLDHRLDGNAVFAERTGNPGDHPWLIRHHQTQVVGAMMLCHRNRRFRLQLRERYAEHR